MLSLSIPGLNSAGKTLMRNSALSFCLFFQACSLQEWVNQEVSFTPFPQTEGKKITGNLLTENNEDEYQVFVPFCAREIRQGIRSSQ